MYSTKSDSEGTIENEQHQGKRNDTTRNYRNSNKYSKNSNRGNHKTQDGKGRKTRKQRASDNVDASSVNEKFGSKQQGKIRSKGSHQRNGKDLLKKNLRENEPRNKKQGTNNMSQPKIIDNSQRSNKNSRRKTEASVLYPPHRSLDDCLVQYNAKDPTLIRGTLRVLPSRDAASFCTCDRGSQTNDVLIAGPLERNRAFDGDQVFVELLPIEEPCSSDGSDVCDDKLYDRDQDKQINFSGDGEANDVDKEDEAWWQDDTIQVDLWDPVVPIQREKIIKVDSTDTTVSRQRQGRVVCIVPPKDFGSEINPTKSSKPQSRTRKIVGTLKHLHGGKILLASANRSLPQFKLSRRDAERFANSPSDAIFSAKYVYGSWLPDSKWPPCHDVQQFGMCANVEDETTALLIDNQVDHGEFPASVLEECQAVVASGEYSNNQDSGWKPTAEMYEGRRDLRQKRIFTIDPTTAKDLDDALHIEELENGQIELGVHIADVSHFVQPNSEIDLEARRRCTTVYLVDRVLPMLPRPLCEIACSLNENVERLAFSCIWRMHKDGRLVKGHKVWYGKSVIRSCARLDYATAQNIIDGKVSYGENDTDPELWPLSRRPSGKHTTEEVAADVRLMHLVGMARRQLRFQNGAIALNAVKLTFQLDTDRETPLLCEPYPIRDSNRLVEEYMLLANYLVAQRLITHASGKALLRNHEAPLLEGLEKVAELAKQTIGFSVDISSSEALQRSLNRLGRECSDELVLKCITEMLKLPMRAATYVAAGSISNTAWAHFALNIPYYTHFTSPIRRYADVIVHRLLQATIEGQEAIDDFVLSQREIQNISERCNEKKEGSRKAQDRSDVVFLALYLRRKPMKSQMGIVLSVGLKTFNVFVPSLGISSMLFLEEHSDWIDSEAFGEDNAKGRRIKLVRKCKHNDEKWKEMIIEHFFKIRVKCKCQEKPPINLKLELEGPW